MGRILDENERYPVNEEYKTTVSKEYINELKEYQNERLPVNKMTLDLID